MTDCFNTVTIQSGILEELNNVLAPLTKMCSHICVLSDNTVMAQYGDLINAQLKLLGVPFSSYLLPQGECNKSLEVASNCWQKLDANGLDRSSLIIALGGGAVTDVAGFVASTFMRGISFVSIPTTLVGMCDASIGGKNGVNLGDRKNLIGSFFNPKAVIIDPATITSLPDRELKSGIAEMIKYGLIGDADFFLWLKENMALILERDPVALTHAITRCCRMKCHIVDQDPFDRGCRHSLNFGHTFGHAIESATGYQQLLHGEAVSIGMSCAAHLSQQLGFVDGSFLEQIEEVCKKAGLPTNLPSITDEVLIEKMLRDKKTKRGTITCIVAKEIGEVVKLDNIAPQIVKEALLSKREHAERTTPVTT